MLPLPLYETNNYSISSYRSDFSETNSKAFGNLPEISNDHLKNMFHKNINKKYSNVTLEKFC